MSLKEGGRRKVKEERVPEIRLYPEDREIWKNKLRCECWDMSGKTSQLWIPTQATHRGILEALRLLRRARTAL